MKSNMSVGLQDKWTERNKERKKVRGFPGVEYKDSRNIRGNSKHFNRWSDLRNSHMIWWPAGTDPHPLFKNEITWQHGYIISQASTRPNEIREMQFGIFRNICEVSGVWWLPAALISRCFSTVQTPSTFHRHGWSRNITSDPPCDQLCCTSA